MSGLPPVTLRSARDADCVMIAAIYAHHVRAGSASFEIDAPNAAEIERRFQEVALLRLPYLVATRGDDVVGYAYAAPYRPRPAYRYTVEDSVYVRADCAGQGIGRSLLDELVARCERWGARQMIAVIGDSANAASIGVHAASGFVHLGTLRDVGWKFGRWLDVVLMQRALGPGASKQPAEDQT
jgi:phosphinothricin acetyltransferase